MDKKLDDELIKLENLIETKSKEFGTEYAKNVEEKFTALQEKQFEQIKAQQTQLDALSVKFEANHSAAAKKPAEMISAEFYEKMAAFGRNEISTAYGDLNIKATMTAANNYTGDVVLPDQLPQIYNNPFADPTRARNLVGNGTTTETNSVSFTTGTVADSDAAPTPTAPAADKPENEYDFTESNYPIRTIAATARITNQMLSDKTQLQSWINSVMVQRLLNVEDTQLITGDGTGQNLTGLIPSATTVTKANSGAATDANAQQIDCLRAGLSYLAKNRYRASVIALNPADYYNIVGLKDADNDYLNMGLTYSQTGELRLYGVPVIAHNLITEDNVLMGDLRNAYLYLMREGLSARLFEQDRDNVLKNLQTFRVEMRSVGVPLLPTGLATFDFTTLIADLVS